MAKLNIALLSGGDSSEREIALQSAANVEKGFDANRYDVYTIDVNGRDWNYTDRSGKRWPVDKTDFSLTINGAKTIFDYAYIMIHGTPGEDGKLQAYLDMMKVPYSSGGFVSMAVTFEKTLCKKTVSSIPGINLAREILVRKGEKVDPEAIVGKLGLPLFVKPNASGSSYGVTKVKRVEEIKPAIDRAFWESDAVLIEEYIAGREFGCGIVITKEKEYVLPVTEIKSRNEFFDYEAKYTPGASEEITPAEITPELTAELQRLGAAIYRECDCRGIVRVDFIVTPEGKPYMVEVNAIPGMSGGSIVPKQLAAARIGLGEVIDAIIADTTYNPLPRIGIMSL